MRTPFRPDDGPLFRREAIDGEFTEATAVQPDDGAALAGEHAFDLMVTSLDDLEPCIARAENFEFRGKTRFVPAIEQQFSARENICDIRRQWRRDRDFVKLRNLALRGSPAMHDVADVRDEQRARRVLVEPANARDGWVAPHPLRREQIIDRRTLGGIV